MPFVAVLANPEVIETNTILNSVYLKFEFENSNQFMYVLGVAVFLLLVFSLIFKALTIYFQLKFITLREASIGRRLLRGYLSQSYPWFLNHNSSNIGSTLLSEVGTIINGAFIPMMTLISQSAVAIAILTLLVVVDPKIAISLAFFFGTLYALIYMGFYKHLNQSGVDRVQMNEERFMAVSEAFGSIKELKVYSLESTFLKRFSKPAKKYALYQASSHVIGQLPRFMIEGLAFGGLMLSTLYLMLNSNGFDEVVPIISLYAFAGYRLMPAFQQIYQSLTQLGFTSHAVDSLCAEMKSLSVCIEDGVIEDNISLERSIELKNVSYKYPGASKSSIQHINLSISAKSLVGIVGGTGGGKTTTVDLIMGLLEASNGTLEVDGLEITTKNLQSWQSLIGYVPQQIYLSDNTVLSNIAFGIDAKDISQESVERAAKIANLHEFVINDLPQGYMTVVGEKGARLSGGQRQRIGIARALYRNPQLLVFDEATSSLDSLTEQLVMEAVHNVRDDMTIIMIAHRLSTVKKCDLIFLVENGRVREQGTYEELSIKSKEFQKMAGIST